SCRIYSMRTRGNIPIIALIATRRDDEQFAREFPSANRPNKSNPWDVATAAWRANSRALVSPPHRQSGLSRRADLACALAAHDGYATQRAPAIRLPRDVG